MEPTQTVSLIEWLVARAKRRGEPVEPLVRRLVLAVIEEVRDGLARTTPK